MMDDYNSSILVAFVVILFTIFSIVQIKTGFRKIQYKEGSQLHNILRVVFAIPLLAISLIALVLFITSLIP